MVVVSACIMISLTEIRHRKLCFEEHEDFDPILWNVWAAIPTTCVMTSPMGEALSLKLHIRLSG